MSGYQNNSIFWVETEKILANPFQPRREFDQNALDDLADSIRQYGVLQPLVVTRKEEETESGGYYVFYELIAGERRLRASRLAGLNQVPVIIRKQTDDKVRLELAIIENLQREDLNPIDRALAFEQLHQQFNLTHAEIGKRMGKSRVYVSNSLRLLSLPEEIREGLITGKISEGHTRPLLMLSDKPEEQTTLFKEIILKKMSVRDSEKIARKIAQDRVRKKEFLVDPRIRDYEVKLSENLGTRVQIEQKEQGGKITIDYFTLKDLEGILSVIEKKEEQNNYNNFLDKNNDFDFLSGQISINDKKQKVQQNDDIKDENIENDKSDTEKFEKQELLKTEDNQKISSKNDILNLKEEENMILNNDIKTEPIQQQIENTFYNKTVNSNFENIVEKKEYQSPQDQQNYNQSYQQEYQNYTQDNIYQTNNILQNTATQQQAVQYYQNSQNQNAIFIKKKKQSFFSRLFG